MQANFSTLYPESWSDFAPGLSPLRPFADEVVSFLSELSSSILADRSSRLYPDVVTFAYFCRKGNLLKIKETYTKPGEMRLGRGIVFHIAPSNVPVNFAYSLVAGMLAGNLNIVRVSSKPFPQVDIIVRHIAAIADKHPAVGCSLAVVRYDRTSQATAMFSSMAAVRVIWGGDATIATIRQCELPPRSFDVCFADRYSIAVLSAAAINSASDDEIHRLATGFYNDTYLFDQNACSAPHTIVWVNDGDVAEAKRRFWASVHAEVKDRYQLQPVMAVDKLIALYSEAISEKIHQESMPDNLAVRVSLETLSAGIERYRSKCGYFNEATVSSLDEIAPIITPRYQTLSYFGIDSEAIRAFILSNRPSGIDRIVPIGHTTDFSLTWDGYNLIDTLSRVLTLG